MTELKPCPFCGSPVGEIHIGLTSARIRCINCSARVEIAPDLNDTTAASCLDSLIGDWNNRVKE